MKYLKDKIKRVDVIEINNISKDEMCSIVFRITYMLQNFVYWESIIISKNETPKIIKDILLNDISEEVSNLRIGTHATLASNFRNKVIEATKINTSPELLKEIQIMSDYIIKELTENSFIFGFAFLTTIENYNSMNLLESISDKLNIGKIPYIAIHKIEDHSEGGHADIFQESIKGIADENNIMYKKGVDLAIKMINFRLGF